MSRYQNVFYCLICLCIKTSYFSIEAEVSCFRIYTDYRNFTLQFKEKFQISHALVLDEKITTEQRDGNGNLPVSTEVYAMSAREVSMGRGG